MLRSFYFSFTRCLWPVHLQKILSSIKHFFFSVALLYNAGHVLIHEVSRSYTMTHHSRLDSSGRSISSSPRPLPNNTNKHKRRTSMPPKGFEPTIPSRWAAADLRLRPRGQWDRPHEAFVSKDFNVFFKIKILYFLLNNLILLVANFSHKYS